MKKDDLYLERAIALLMLGLYVNCSTRVELPPCLGGDAVVCCDPFSCGSVISWPDAA
jgi:hypothetical protein